MVKPITPIKDLRTDRKGRAQSELHRAVVDSTIIDQEARTIKNVLLCQAMRVKGQAGTFYIGQGWDEWYGWEKVEAISCVTPQEFIDTLGELGKAYNQTGQKTFFGHPNQSSEMLGKQIGRIKNIRVEGDGVVGDVEIGDYADDSPEGKLGTYILKMAAGDPESVMMSIVFLPGAYYFMENGAKVEYDWSDEHFDRIMALPEDERVMYESVVEWIRTDFVHEGANTNNLFRGIDDSESFAALVTDFLDKKPEIYDFVNKNPQVLERFLKKYEAHKARTLSKQQKQMSKPKKNWLQRSADFVTELMSRSEGQAVTVRNIDATTSDGANITIMTSSDVPVVGDIVQLTDTGEVPPAATHTIAGGDLDGYQITTDDTGAITEVVEPTAAASEETSSDVDPAAIRSMIAEEIAKAIGPLATELRSFKSEFNTFKSNPLVKKAAEGRNQISSTNTRETEMPAWEKEMAAKTEKFARKQTDAE
jgi:hypothetical protein